MKRGEESSWNLLKRGMLEVKIPNEGSSWNNHRRRGLFENLEDKANENEGMSSEENEDVETGESDGDEDIINLPLPTLTELKSFKFADPEAAFNLYFAVALRYGFCARKNKSGTIKRRDQVCHKYHSFVCCREGRHDHRTDIGPVIRCGCAAQMRIQLDEDSGLWYVAYLTNAHNHSLVDIDKMNSIVDALEDVDAQNAIKYLYSMAFTDNVLYWSHKVDDNGVLSHLFWSDGVCQVDYKTFGDVLAIDATYKMNKHNYRLVVFSGSNHHNKMCVFGSAIVSDLSEETCIWLLHQFVEMKGNCPQLVITNGDNSMKNAINFVFPQANHRLCSWNLLRNASAKVQNKRFTDLFKECMMEDCEVWEWEDKWKAMVKECGVKHIEWVQDMYKVKSTWATAHIRGNFFQGYRTSSRCEGFLKQVNKFDQSRSSLAQLVINFQQCLESMGVQEFKDDIKTFDSVPVLQTLIKPLEESGISVYTHAMFYKYQSVLVKSYPMKVLLNPKKTASSTIYTVSEYLKPFLNWTVTFYPEDMKFRCSCFRMESFGIPCVHIIKVLFFMNIVELPKSLVLNRWTKKAKEGVEETSVACRSDNDVKGKKKRVACGSSKVAKKHGKQIGSSTVGGIGVARRSKGCGQ